MGRSLSNENGIASPTSSVSGSMLRRARPVVPHVLVAAACAASLASCTHTSPGPNPTVAAQGAAAQAMQPPVAPPPVIGRLDASRQGSGVLLADLDGRRVAYVADEDESRVRVIDVDAERELSSFAPGGVPAAMVMLPDGRLVVAVRDAAHLLVLRGGGTAKSPLVVDTRIDVAAEPVGLALSTDDETLVVTSGWGRTVTVLEAHTFTRKFEQPVAREPRSVVISKDGKRAFVSHAVGQTLDIVPLDGTKAKKPLTLGGSEEVFGRGMMTNTQARVACQGFALAKAESGRVFAPHVLVFPGEQEVSSGYGGGEGREAEVFHVPVIDEDSATIVAESKTLRGGFDSPNQRCALPRAATAGKAGLFVTCLGEDTVMLLDADAMNPHDVVLKRWSVPAGPTAIALDEAQDRAVVWSQFAHSLTTIAIGEGGDARPRPFALSSITLVRTNEDAKVERGRVLFHSTTELRISGDGRACASCHPDGRDDTLVWSSPKGPRQTPILAGRLDGAAPFGWNGDAPDVSQHLVQTVKRLGGKGLEGEDKEALMAYVRAMRPPPSKVARGAPEAVERGLAIYQSEQAGCASCHGAAGELPDGSQHDVKSRSAIDLQAKFDTPSLRFVGGSAPYFHDGRYPDLETLLVKSDNKMGHTKHLSPGELADLKTYLETL
ncbi:MAG: Surface antigen protein [Labilithrix sp.]|nr:Surface antigen protein [Labilithrix sp.]